MRTQEGRRGGRRRKREEEGGGGRSRRRGRRGAEDDDGGGEEEEQEAEEGRLSAARRSAIMPLCMPGVTGPTSVMSTFGGGPGGEVRRGGPSQKARKASGLLRSVPSFPRRHKKPLRRREGF